MLPRACCDIIPHAAVLNSASVALRAVSRLRRLRGRRSGLSIFSGVVGLRSRVAFLTELMKNDGHRRCRSARATPDIISLLVVDVALLIDGVRRIVQGPTVGAD